MSDAKNQQAEPSMEEILASIRRIISEDTDAGKGQAAAPAAAAPAPAPAAQPAAAAPPPPPPPPPQPAPAPAADVLELTEMVGDDGKVTDVADKKPAAAPAPPPPPAPEIDGRLFPPRAASAAAGALAGLAAASRKPEGGAPTGLGNGAMTLEEIVRSEMRPILKAWLDENLPPLVERLVQKEIKRITRQVDEP
jgi:cell pole-organizing protein PopZ